MSSPHSFVNRPPVVYRTTTPWWLRLARRVGPWLVLVAVIVGLVAGTTLLIAKLHATQAQLDLAHLDGMATGMTMCGGLKP